MKIWTEIQTAYCVARLGTVSAAAAELGLHRATVNRHVDRLEAHLGTRLFLRHRQGYGLTDAGRDFLSVAGRAHEMLGDFAGRARLRDAPLEGDVIVTTLPPITTLIMPAITDFRLRHPRTRVTLLTDTALHKLEHGEAHVALRAGERPRHDDYVVQPYGALEVGLYAHRDYLARRGMPEGLDLRGHDLIGNASASSAPFERWLAAHVDPEQIVLRCNTAAVVEQALRCGAGIGFLPVRLAAGLPNLHQIGPCLPEWRSRIWQVTHVDLHRSAKVRAMLDCLAAVAPGG